jgi:acyl carrier protein
MEHMENIDLVAGLVANTLGIPVDTVTDELAFSQVAEWDSLNHVNLMLALEQSLHTEIDEERMIQLTSVRAIRDFVAECTGSRA